MEILSKKERELVSLGTALGSNCIPCVVYHMKEALKNGISEEQLKEAIELAEKIKKIPAQRVRESAYAQLNKAGEVPSKSVDSNKPDCCG